MNSSDIFLPRKRSQNLLIVEGSHEKNVLFKLLFKCFPELKIDMDEIWIYGTNIYILYNDIVKEYGGEWYNEDVDLPFVISKNKNPSEQRRYKDDFVNIILVFDYEHHDPNFSEDKINILQEYFNDMTNVGQLFINYPMIESYQDVEKIPDENYIDKKVSVKVNPGKKYKALVKNSFIYNIVGLPQKIFEILNDRFSVDFEKSNISASQLLELSCYESLNNDIDEILKKTMGNNFKTAQYQLNELILKFNYIRDNMSYWAYLRDVFIELIIMNLRKAICIQGSQVNNKYDELYGLLDLSNVLKEQNSLSRDDDKGQIWILNTCIFVVAEYNSKLLF